MKTVLVVLVLVSWIGFLIAWLSERETVEEYNQLYCADTLILYRTTGPTFIRIARASAIEKCEKEHPELVTSGGDIKAFLKQ